MQLVHITIFDQDGGFLGKEDIVIIATYGILV
jgi:hypothetical protein